MLSMLRRPLLSPGHDQGFMLWEGDDFEFSVC